MARILETNNYGRFILGLFQREAKRIWRLERLFIKYGGMSDQYPVVVTRVEGSDKLKIHDGHHRFVVARKLGMAVKYLEVREEDVISQVDRDAGHKNHSLGDYMFMFAQAN